MSGIKFNLEHFIDVNLNKELSLGDDKIDERAIKNDGELFGRLVHVITRSDEEKTANKKVTKAFFEALEGRYGKRLKDYAIEGYENREFDGKPLTGRRVQSIIARAIMGLQRDHEMLNRSLHEEARPLLEKALRELGIRLPAKGREEWLAVLTAKVIDAIEKDRAFLDPTRIEAGEGFESVFAPVVKDLIENEMKIGVDTFEAFETKHREMVGQIKDGTLSAPDGFSWGKLPPEDLEKLVFPQDYRKRFVDSLGTKDLETYSVGLVDRAKRKYEEKLGVNDPKSLGSLSQVGSTPCNNGVYVGRPSRDMKKINFSHLELGIGRTRDFAPETLHISVSPSSFHTAFHAIAPLLLDKDCPIKHWTATNIDQVRDSYLEASESLKDPNLPLPERRNLEQRRDSLLKAILSSQFTLRLMPGQTPNDEGVVDLLLEIERRLREAGVEMTEPPLREEMLGRYVTIDGALDSTDSGIIEMKSDAYRGAINSIGDRLIRARNEPDLNVRIDKLVAAAGEFHRLAERIGALDLDERTKNDLFGLIEAMRRTLYQSLSVDQGGTQHAVSSRLERLVDLMRNYNDIAREPHLEGEARLIELQERRRTCLAQLDLLKGEMELYEQDGGPTRAYINFLETELRREIGYYDDGIRRSDVSKMVSHITHGHIVGTFTLAPSMRTALNTVERSTFPEPHKSEMKEILTLAGRIMAKTDSDLSMPPHVRLQMAGELGRLGARFRELTSELRSMEAKGRTDRQIGQDDQLRTSLVDLVFAPNMGLQNFINVNDEETRPERTRLNQIVRDMCEVGIALNTLDHGDEGLTDLDDEDRKVLGERIARLEGFLDDYNVEPRISQVRFEDEIERLKTAIQQQ